MRIFASYIKYLLLLIIIASCTQVPSLEKLIDGDRLEYYEQQPLFPDLPMPQNSDMLTDKSIILGRDDNWTGKIALISPSTIEEVFVFYQQQMPTSGWIEITSLQGMEAKLIYTKENRVASIVITPSRFGGSSIDITLSPNRSSALNILK